MNLATVDSGGRTNILNNNIVINIQQEQFWTLVELQELQKSKLNHYPIILRSKIFVCTEPIEFSILK